MSLLTAASVAIGIMAFAHPGFTTTDVDMTDGGLWVTNLEEGQLGHLNYQAQELDSGLVTSSEQFDVLQNDGIVIVVDATNSSLNPVDTGQASFRGDIALPGIVEVTLRGGTVTVLDRQDGRLWVTPASSLGGLNFEETDPIAVLGTGAAATADDSGGVHAISQQEQTVFHWVTSDEGYTLASEQTREGLADAEELTVTTVGEQAIVLDSASGTLYLPDGETSVAKDAVLQHPGPSSNQVLLATGSHLIRQPLDGGGAASEEYASGGDAVAPVQLETCIYAAWPGDARVIRECDDSSMNLDEMTSVRPSGAVVFREHRGIVALNDGESGIAWLMAETLVMVDNWADLIPPTSDEDTEELDEDSMDDTIDNIAPDPSEENNPPVANDDTMFGARTGRSTLVPVLHNDSDADGDILTVSLVGDAPEGVRISPVQNSSQFQVEIPADFSANGLVFQYQVDDGRGGTDEATVTLTIRDEGQNDAPEQLREQSFEVEQRAQYDHGVLDSWFDPDGDDLFLVDAYSDSGDTVRFNPNGRLIYTATGEPGPTTMTVVVSDGLTETEGTVQVEVRERGTGNPMANADYVTVPEGGHTSVKPLANDFLPAGENARLASAGTREDSGITVSIDRSTDTIHITGGSVGTHFIDYTVAAGPNQAQGHVRVDVVEPVEGEAPVAVRDVALLPMTGEALVDLTDNDVDPSGGMLVVQSIEHEASEISVQLVQRHLLRIEDIQGLSERTTLRYHVSNGTETAVGEIVVIPVEPPAQPRNPVAVEDTVTLREGDFTSIDVTENDFSPDNIPFEVNPELIESSLLPEEGHIFVDGNELRVHVAVGGPSYVDATYEITDNQGNSDTATVRVEVEPRDSEVNNPPHAREVSARVLAGNTVRIPIPLNGIDPDGDGVELVGWETAPDKGRITQVGPDYFDFEAFSGDSGTTAFEYRVRDRWGAESVSVATIGIAQPSAVNQSPHAALDPVHVRPGRAVAVSVLDNDTDPDGDELRLTDINTEDAPSGFADLRLGSETATVNFTAPLEPGDYMLEYTIEDARGATAIGAIHVTVDEEAPLIAPSAVDDVVDVAELTVGEPFVVPVLENDRDVDGDPTELEVEVLTGAGEPVEGGVRVIPGEEFQVIAYRATDRDGGHGDAFIYVPGVGEKLPYVNADTVLYAESGIPLEIALSDIVEMPNGGTPRITTNDSVSATNSDDGELVIDEHTLSYTSALGYTGEAAISFEVTDGEGPNDPDAVTARLTVPIVVTSSSQVPPEFHGAVIQIEPGEAPTSFDLRNATWDPDDGDVDAMEYEHVGGEADGITVSIDGPELRASAEASTPAGTQGAFQLELRDPAGNVVPGTVSIEVVASKRAQPRAVTDTGTTDQGVEISINVIRNDFNPFQNTGDPLIVRDVRVLQGEVQSGPETDGTNVTVTPASQFAGVLTLQYTIEDATQSDARTAVGSVEINVRGRPEAPLRPNVTSIGDSQVTLSWAAPSSNGAQITGYIVEWDGGSQECASTTCTVTGLTNDTVYNFTVKAENEVGESDPSPPSIDARPDVRPGQPNAPTVERGDGELRVTWEAPENNGSPIQFYLLEISGLASGQETQVRVEGTSFTWEGLRNGNGYTFRVQAHNNADEPSEWSRFSRESVPAGAPFASADVTASSTTGPSRTQVNVAWVESDDNGAPITRYTVVVLRGGREVNSITVGGQTFSQAFENLDTSTDPYSFRVIAHNDVGDSPPATSNEVRSVGKPGTPSLALVSDNENETSTINVTPGDANGYAERELTYQYSLDGGGWQNLPGAGQQTLNPVPRIGGYTLQVRVIAGADGHNYESDASSRITISPYGTPPAPPVPTARENGNTVTFSWDARDSTNGRAIRAVEYQINGGNWQSASPNHQISQTGSPGDEISVRIRSIPEEGPKSPPSGEAKVTIKGPKPTLTVSPGDRAVSEVDPSVTAYEVVLDYSDVMPGRYSYSCYSTNADTGGDPFRTGTVNLDASGQVGDSAGSNQQQLCVNSQGGQLWVVLTSGPSVQHHGNLESNKRNWPS